MTELVLYPTTTAQWHALVNDAQLECALELGDELESYLVYLLMRFSTRPDLAHSVMALKFLEGMTNEGRVRALHMRDVGEQCLLLSGLFPRRAQRRRVKLSYFVELGQGAFYDLAGRAQDELAQLYAAICQYFVKMMDVLQAMRQMGGEPALDRLAALELWQDTGSELSRRCAGVTAPDGALELALPGSKPLST
jgi:hypothetical protein